MASMRDIKRRRDSIESTGQITKAMKLVSTVKLQKVKSRAEKTKPYSDLMYETVSNILAKSGNINHKFLKPGKSNKKAIIVITSNRGLAGGYNSNITKLITNSTIPKDDIYIYAIGSKGRDVVLIEDIVDTGTTMHYFKQMLREMGAKSVAVTAFLFKPEALLYPDAEPEYVGKSIPRKFVLGYGLDYDGYGRNIPAVYALKG